MASLGEQLKAFAEKTKADMATVVRQSGLRMGQQMVVMSPVGQPDTWKANKNQAYMRETYNLFADAINADLQPGEKRVRRKSAKALRKEFANVAGKGYVGGRFRANWQYGEGAINTDTSQPPDASGNGSIGRIKVGLDGWTPGQTIFITNSLPYSLALEYGHSKQAPGGFVRITVADFQNFVTQAIASVR